jgi:DNA-3-methyladenine glycosylase
MNKIFDQQFFERPTLQVAQDLIGSYLVRKTSKGSQKYIITEVEAYDGPDDRACHASKGCTDRTQVMFGPGGHFYIYLCYGVHWMLNIVTGPANYPSAVLIRGVGDFNGPGKVTKNLKINKSFNGKPARRKTGLWIEENPQRTHRIIRAPRIGVDYAGPVWSKKKYRYLININ